MIWRIIKKEEGGWSHGWEDNRFALFTIYINMLTVSSDVSIYKGATGTPAAIGPFFMRVRTHPIHDVNDAWRLPTPPQIEEAVRITICEICVILQIMRKPVLITVLSWFKMIIIINKLTTIDHWIILGLLYVSAEGQANEDARETCHYSFMAICPPTPPLSQH